MDVNGDGDIELFELSQFFGDAAPDMMAEVPPFFKTCAMKGGQEAVCTRGNQSIEVY